MQPQEQQQRSDDLALDLRQMQPSPWIWRVARGPRWRHGSWGGGRGTRRRRGRLVALAVTLLVVLAGGTVAVVLALRGPAATYQPVRLGDLTLSARGTGPVAGTIYDVSFAANAPIAEIDTQVGQHVSKGQVLARLDITALQNTIKQAQAQVDAANAALNSALVAQSRITAAAQALASAALAQEQNALYTCQHESAPPPDCATQARSQYAATTAQARANEATADAQVAVARASLTQAQNQLRTAQDALAGATATAPAAGVVGAINGAVGGLPGQVGASAATASGAPPFMEIVDMSTVRVTVAVDAASIGQVTAGDPVAFTIGIYDQRVFHGTVSAISPLGQVSARTVTYPVTIQVDPASLGDVSLLPGLTANATITTTQRFAVLLVPAAAIAFARADKTRSGATLVPRAQIAAVLAEARQMAAQVSAAEAAAGPDVPSDNPTAAYVLEQTRGGWVARPVVLGLGNGAAYEVLAGLHEGQLVATGAR